MSATNPAVRRAAGPNAAGEHRVGVADCAVATGDEALITVGLGSCVAILMYDPVAHIGGLAHVLLPSIAMSQDRENHAKFAVTAVPMLVERMRLAGATPARLQAKLVGGASMFTSLLSASGLQIGERNVIAARQALERAGIPIIAQDVGGDYGRSVHFRVSGWAVVVRSLRNGSVTL